MVTPEQKLKTKLKEYIEKTGGYWAIVQGGPYSKPGDPDIICCLNGKFIGIEAKVHGNKPSEKQNAMGRWIERSGGIFLVVYSLGELEDEFRARGLLQI